MSCFPLLPLSPSPKSRFLQLGLTSMLPSGVPLNFPPSLFFSNVLHHWFSPASSFVLLFSIRIPSYLQRSSIYLPFIHSFLCSPSFSLPSLHSNTTSFSFLILISTYTFVTPFHSIASSSQAPQVTTPPILQKRETRQNSPP